MQSVIDELNNLRCFNMSLFIERLNSDIATLMELKLVVANRQLAKYLYKSWVDKASQTYALIHDTLLD